MLKIDMTTVAVSAQGHDATINVADYPTETLAYWLTYGIRRAYQDGINSVAKKLRDEGQPVDGAALFADRDKVFREASMGTRDGSGDSPDVREAKSMLRVQVKKSDAAKYKNATPAERDEMVNAEWDKLSDKARESYLATAKARLELKAKQAAELAALATGVEI